MLPYKIEVAAPSGTEADIFQPLVLIFWKSKLMLLGLPKLSYINAEILRFVPIASSLGKFAPKFIWLVGVAVPPMFFKFIGFKFGWKS